MLEQAKHMSFSRLNVLSSCRMKYNYKYIEYRESPDPVPDFLNVGKIIDKALESAQKKEVRSFEDVLEEGKIDFLDEKWFHFCRGVWEKRRDLYEKVYGFAEVELQTPVEIYILDKETGEMIANDEGKSIPFIGYLDARDKTKNIIYEVKTVSSGIDQTFIEHKFGGQTQIYDYALIEQEGLSEIPLVIYVYVKKPLIRKGKKETIEEFYKRMYEKGRDVDVEFREVNYTREELDETMAYYFDRISKDLYAEPVRDRNACWKFGNRCEYYNYCWKNQISSEPEKNENVA